MTSDSTQQVSSRSSSPTGQQIPSEPLRNKDLNAVVSNVCEKLLTCTTEPATVHLKASWRRKDSPSAPLTTSHGKARRDGIEIWAVWEDDLTTEYPFPHAELNYYVIEILDQEHASLSVQQAPSLGGGRPLPPQYGSQEVSGQETVPPSLKLQHYEPVTYEAWINARNDDGFKIRDLMRELREAPEFGLRLNQYFYDKNFVKQQERNFDNLLGRWILLARQTQDWNKGTFIELGNAIVQSLRDAYWRARKIDVEDVHRKISKDERSNDKFYQHVADQLTERDKAKKKYYAANFSAPYYPPPFQGFPPPPPPPPGPSMQANIFPGGPPYRNRLLCFNCRSPDHILRQCPHRRQQPDFRSRVSGTAHQSGKSL